ncbi:heterokaryon incompatibility protein [Rutstroemia sp. NJR-2017a BBW]|nr:heterokaryon incompatibility protein [Rutstroemia sp. NJR-2017a BBW]
MVVYRPLRNHQIRVIKLLTEADSPGYGSGPVRCELEYVDLACAPISTEEGEQQLAKGYNGHWVAPVVEDIEPEPRVRGRADTNAMWPEDHTHRPIASGSTDEFEVERAEVDLPWRYPWGDYVALSYVWGDSNPAGLREIYVDGSPFRATRNLEAALKELRKHYRIKQGFRIWADAICINQKDIDERGSQVAMMRQIYNAAWHIVIWLGPKANNSDLAMIALRYFSLRSKKYGNPLEGVSKRVEKIINIGGFPWKHRATFIRLRMSVHRALYHLLCRPYFRRLWVLQEVALGTENMPVLCGDRCVQVEDIYRTVKLLRSNGAEFGTQIMAFVHFWSDMQKSWYQTRGDTYRYSERLWERPIAMLEAQNKTRASDSVAHGGIFGALLLGRESHASDERDRIYGILGMRQLAAIHIIPDYNLTAKETFILFTKRLFASGDFNGLRLATSEVPHIATRYMKFINFSRPKNPKFVHHNRLVNAGCTHSLPSWVICWSCPPNPAINLPGHSCLPLRNHTPTVVFHNDMTMTLQGVIFDTINSLSAFHTTESDLSYPSDGPRVTSIYGDRASTNEALWRTLVGNTTSTGDPAPASYRSILQSAIWDGSASVPNRRKMFLLSDFFSRNKKMRLFNRTLEDIILGPQFRDGFEIKNLRVGYVETLDDVARREYQDAILWAMRVLAWRRLVVTRGGYLGLAPAAAKAGDVVVVVPGCDVPLVLRREGERFRVLGEGYVHGIMAGELQGMLEQGTRKLVDITLC